MASVSLYTSQPGVLPQVPSLVVLDLRSSLLVGNQQTHTQRKALVQRVRLSQSFQRGVVGAVVPCFRGYVLGKQPTNQAATTQTSSTDEK